MCSSDLIHLKLDSPDLRVDGIPDVCNRLPEGSQRITQPFTKALHIVWRQSGRRLSRFRFQRGLLGLHTGYRFLIHDSRRAFRHRLSLCTGG